jgi:hypothetical protein
MILPETLCGMRGEHAEFGEKRASFDQGGVIRFAMFKSYGAAAHHQDSIGQSDSLIDVVRDEQDAGLMVGDEFANEIVHADTRERVERGERLVQQQKLRLLHQRAGEGHALRLSTGKVARPIVEPIAEPDLSKRGRGPLARVRHMKAERDIAPETVPRQQAMFLKHNCRPPWCCDASTLNGIEAGQCS